MRRPAKRQLLLWGGIALALCLLVPVILHYEQALFDWVRSQYDDWLDSVDAYPFTSRVVYLAVFTLVIGLFIPGGIVLLLLAGALFPFYEAVALASVGNLMGAVINFLLARRFGKPWMHRHHYAVMEQMHKGMEESGWVYLLVLRIAPVIPSPLVNIGMGVTHISLPVYGFITLLGRAPMTVVYVHFGRELGQITSLMHLLSMETFLILMGVGIAVLCAHVFLKSGMKTA